MNSQLLSRALHVNDWHIKDIEGLHLAHSPLLSSEKDLIHAFTTRIGGSCPEPYDSFNLGRSVGDEAVKKAALLNREKLCQTLGLTHDRLHVPGQVHSGNVVHVGAESAVHPGSQALSGVDGLTTADRGLPLLLHFADCVPVMVYERRRRLLSIVHAGWRGTAEAIAAQAVKRMVEMGGEPKYMLAAVGPAIGTCCYPTGEDVAVRLMSTVCSDQTHSQAGSAALVQALVLRREDGQPRPNLKAINALQLLQQGVGEVDVTSFCTSCKPELFFSHRQSGGVTGRQGAIACLL
jgi:hypothetical protein